MKEIKVGIIGFGTVGGGVVEGLLNNGELIAARTGIKLVLTKILDRNPQKDRGVKVPEGVVTTDINEVIDNVDIVVELIGGTTAAKEFILKALSKGKAVVTANKALLAEHGAELFEVAQKTDTDLYYEASVAGGIPIIKALRESLAGNKIESIYGIMNGTCNYILTRMKNESIGFAPILKDAQELGYAEAEPSLDVDGFDTAHKAIILASLAYGHWFSMDDISVEGITNITLKDLQYAEQFGYSIKLLAVIKHENKCVQMRVSPTLVPKESMLANIHDVFNGVMVTGDTVGETLFYGQGAGRNATASAVISDIIDVALNMKDNCIRRIPPHQTVQQFDKILSLSEVETRYYLRLQVNDSPGVIAKISKILSDKNISISSIHQPEQHDSGLATMLILTHQALENSVKEAIAEIESLDFVPDKISLLRIEDI